MGKEVGVKVEYFAKRSLASLMSRSSHFRL
jgi:hypothetical protein